MIMVSLGMKARKKMGTHSIEDLHAKVDLVAKTGILAAVRDITLKSTMLGQATGLWAVDTSRKRRYV
jgi:hypothetical protein